MTNSPNAMPGAFNLHSNTRDNTTAPPRLSGAKSHIFQPPRTPGTSASSSLILTRSTTSVMSLSSVGDRSGPSRFATRKRNLEEYNSGTTTPRNDGYRGEYSRMEDTAEGWIPGSPQPFVNTRYQLAGGMDTPSLAAAHAVEGNEYGDIGCRKSLGDSERPSVFNAEGVSYFPDEPAWRESNGRPRLSQGYNDSPYGEGWSKAAIQVANVVVGKVWEFCKNSSAVFKGFQAGGGTRYKINPLEADAQFETVERNLWEEKDGGRDSTPLPGQYPKEDLEYIPDYMDRATPDNTPPRPTKRRQVSANYTLAESKDEITKNWVVIPPPPPPPPPPPTSRTNTTPTRPQLKGPSRYSMPTASSASRRAIANSAAQRPASRAGFGAPATRRPTLMGQASHVSHAGSPALTGGHGASYASPRSPQNSASKIPRRTGSPLGHTRNGGGSKGGNVDSPAAKEAKRWATLKRKEEREADESIRRLDAQLKAMIREGKEALGTKIEVELDDEDFTTGSNRKWAV